jgi:methionyl-tRNA formyltransferase
LRVVFMGTPGFAIPSLRALAQRGHHIVGVYTQPDKPAGRSGAPVASPVKRAALDLGLAVFQPRSLRRADEHERLRALGPDAICLAAYGLLLPQAVLDIPRLGGLNVHPSLLPRHRGAAPVVGAIVAGDTETGVSIMLMDAGMDTGPVLAVQRMPLHGDETAAGLSQQLAELGAGLLCKTLDAWAAGSLAPAPQGEDGVSYTTLLSKEDGLLRWEEPAELLERRVRAYQPWPGSVALLQGKRLLVLAGAVAPDGPEAQPGRVFSPGPGRAAVQTGRGSLELLTVQLEGRRAMAVRDFLAGARGFVGSDLGETAPEVAR